MSQEPSSVKDPVQELREAFDSAFRYAPTVATDPPEDLLAIRTGEVPYALRLSEITGVHRDKSITALPGTPPELAGIAGFRGAVVAIYDLRVLLGTGGTGTCRWLILAAPDSTVGFAFDQFEGHLRVPRADIATEEIAKPELAHPRQTVRVAGVARPIASIPALREAIEVPYQL